MTGVTSGDDYQLLTHGLLPVAAANAAVRTVFPEADDRSERLVTSATLPVIVLQRAERQP